MVNIQKIQAKEISIINLNIAICFINQEQYHNSLKYIDQAIQSDPTYFKVTRYIKNFLELLPESIMPNEFERISRSLTNSIITSKQRTM